MFNVYVLCNPSKPGRYTYKIDSHTIELQFEPFYVGKGAKPTRRFDHFRDSEIYNKQRNVYKNDLIISLLEHHTKDTLREHSVIIFDDLSEQEALKLESKCISTIGLNRLGIGPLLNIFHSNGDRLVKCKNPELYIGRKLYSPIHSDWITFANGVDPHCTLLEYGVHNMLIDNLKSLATNKTRILNGFVFEENYDYYYGSITLYSPYSNITFTTNRVNYIKDIVEHIGNIPLVKFKNMFDVFVSKKNVYGVCHIDNYQTLHKEYVVTFNNKEYFVSNFNFRNNLKDLPLSNKDLECISRVTRGLPMQYNNKRLTIKEKL